MTRKKQPASRSQAQRPQAASNGEIRDGVIRFDIVGGPHDGKSVAMDPLLVKLAAEVLERKHELEVFDGRYQGTPAFAVELSAALEALGYVSTPAIAMHAWVVCAEYFAELQKKTS